MCGYQRTFEKIPVVMAEGYHLYPYRTQKLSPPALMVLGWQRPGRVGRCRINVYDERSVDFIQQGVRLFPPLFSHIGINAIQHIYTYLLSPYLISFPHLWLMCLLIYGLLPMIYVFTKSTHFVNDMN